jgi:hypothetical protein
MTGARVAVIVAASDHDPIATSSIAAFVNEVRGRGEVVVVGTLHEGVSTGTTNVRMIERRPGTLVPLLWRDGLRDVDADWVAFSTIQMVPCARWLDELMVVAERSGADGVGGTIEPGAQLRAVDRAIYLQRYLAYSKQGTLPARPSGENAIYRRDRLMEHESSWEDGFWETEVQRRIEGQGGGWGTAPTASVIYNGSTRFRRILGQRVAHARRFGAIRAREQGPLVRGLRAMTGPLLPGLMAARISRGLIGRGMPIRPWLTAIPPFLGIAGAWASGETIGTLFGLNRD